MKDKPIPFLAIVLIATIICFIFTSYFSGETVVEDDTGETAVVESAENEESAEISTSLELPLEASTIEETTTTEEIKGEETETETGQEATVEETTTEIITTEPTTTAEETATEEQIKSSTLASDEQDMLLRLGMSEAGVESVECIAMVMRVILNRVESDQFPNSISGVITESGQFSVVSNGTYYSAVPNEKCYEALEMVLNGWDESCGALYFEACTNGSSWHSNNLTFICQIGKTRFYK